MCTAQLQLLGTHWHSRAKAKGGTYHYVSMLTMVNYTRIIAMARYTLPLVGLTIAVSRCVVTSGRLDPTNELAASPVKPGITVLLGESMQLIRRVGIGLLTNHAEINEKGEQDIDFLGSTRAERANVNHTILFSPEHGIRGTEDREIISITVDLKSGLAIVWLYGAQT